VFMRSLVDFRWSGAALWVIWGLSWLLGTAWHLQLPQLPSLFVCQWLVGSALALAFVMALLSVLVKAVRDSLVGVWAQHMVAALVAATLAFAWSGLMAHARLADRLAPELEGQDLWLTGTVAELPRVVQDGVRFVLQVEQAHHFQADPRTSSSAVAVPQRVSLGWWRSQNAAEQMFSPNVTVLPGQRWRLPVRLKQVRGLLNPHGFDTELWMLEQQIGATGYVRPGAGRLPQRLNDAPPWQGLVAVEAMRQKIKDAIYQRVEDVRSAGVIAALVVGDQSAIDRADWALFRDTGVAHLMAISGLHVTLFAWIAGVGFAWLWRQHKTLPLKVPAPRAGQWLGVLFAIAYGLLAGWGLPAQRTVVMLVVAAVLRDRGQNWPVLMILLAAAVVVVMTDPWALMQAGFWLSFTAVGLLLISTRAQADAAPMTETWWGQGLKTARAGLHTQLLITVGLAPLTVLLFHQISVVGLVANLVAIPLVTFVITPLALLGVLVPYAWWGAHSLLVWLVQGLEWALQMPGAVWYVPVAPDWAQALGMLGAVMFMLATLPWRWRVGGALLMVPMLWPPVELPSQGQFVLTALDVGQGTAVLVQTRSHVMLYDAGPLYSRESDAGVRVVVPFLRAQGLRHLDALVLSHRDADHVGGAQAVMDALDVHWLTSSLEEQHPLRAKGVPHRDCLAGQSWEWDGVRFSMLHPTVAPPDERLQPAAWRGADKPNARSCVLKIQDAQGRTALLSGDIEAAQEFTLTQAHGAGQMDLRSDWLMVPHHGSRTSSTEAFLDAVAPQWALAQMGYRNRYGHPAPDVVQRYDDRGIRFIRSDQCGAMKWHSQHAPKCWRQQVQRYWRAW
jgi:competence protein ComEC